MTADIIETEVDSDSITDEVLTEYFGTREIRWYQVACRNATIQALENNKKRIMVVLPTGAGKTITIACTVGDVSIRKALKIEGDRPLRVMFVAHKHRLLSQAEATFADAHNVEIITQSMFSDIPKDVLEKGWDICVVDEVHHEACATFQYHLDKLGEFPIIGLTATPDRDDGCLLKFDTIIAPISREEAVEQGYLAETSLHSFVNISKNDKTDIVSEIVDNFSHLMGQTMVFVRTKKEAKAIAEHVSSKGFKAVAVLSQSEAELNNILDQFGRGEIQFIVNCNKISEGVDVKGCTDVVLGRTIGSYAMLNQIIGRAARPDSPCSVWELINPLSSRNMDTTVIVGVPKQHTLHSKERGQWVDREFDYS